MSCARALVLALILSASASFAPLMAQGNDSCASAQAIAGTGTFAFDNTLATTDGQPDGLCNYFGTTQIERDVWWTWTAPTTGTYKLSTCGQTSVDTRLAVYDGSCAGAVLACGDDSCSSQQTEIQFSVTSGNVYIVRLGVYPGAGGGTGAFVLGVATGARVQATLFNPTNQHFYHFLTNTSWTLAEAQSVQLGGHLITVNDQAEHDWMILSFHNWQGVDRDIWLGINDVLLEGTFVWSSGQPVLYTNWDVGEPNNGGTGEDYGNSRYNNPLGLWNDLPNAGTSAHPAVHGLVEIGDQVKIYCTAKVNSAGCTPAIAWVGVPSATTGSGFTISASSELDNKFGLLFYGKNSAAATPFQGGFLCMTAPIQRHLLQNSGGTPPCGGSFTMDFNAWVATGNDPALVNGQKVWGQYWSRDPADPFTTNLTNAVHFTVGP